MVLTLKRRYMYTQSPRSLGCETVNKRLIGDGSMSGDQRHEQCPALVARRRPQAASTPCMTMSLAFLITTLGLTSAISLEEALLADMIPDDADPSSNCQDTGTTVSHVTVEALPM